MPVPTIELRRARSADAPDIWKVRTEAIRSGCCNHYPAELVEEWASAPMPQTFADLIEQEEFTVAVQGSQIVAFAGLKRESREVYALFVCPDFANQKLGTRLLMHLEARARDLGIDAVNLKAALNAVPFYEAAGYTAISNGWNLTTNGLKMACVHMEKALVAGPSTPRTDTSS